MRDKVSEPVPFGEGCLYLIAYIGVLIMVSGTFSALILLALGAWA